MKPNDFLTEQELQELKWAQDLAKAATDATGKVKGAYDDISNAGQAVGGLVGQAVGRPIKGAYDLAKQGVTGALKGAGTVAGDVAKGVGAVAGAPAGVARATKKGYQAGSDYIAGDGAQAAQPSTVNPEVQQIQQQIQQKQGEIQGLEQQLSQAQQKATTATQPTQGASAVKQASRAGAGTVAAVGNAIGDMGRGAADAIQRGKGGLANAADTSYLNNSKAKHSKMASDPNTYNVQDKFGRVSTYKKVGDKWVDPQGNPVDDNFAASIDQAKKMNPQGDAVTGIDQTVANQGDVDKQVAQPDEMGRVEPTMTAQPTTQPTAAPAVWKNNRNPNAPAATTPAGAAPTQKAATPDYSQALMKQPGYSNVSYNVPTGASMNIPKPTPGATIPQAGNVPAAGATPPAAAPKTKVVSGGPTPAEQANLEKRVQAAAAAQPVAESKNFSAILWKQMRDGK